MVESRTSGNASDLSSDKSVDRGQATILMALILAMTVGLALTIVEMGRILDDSAQARTAADAAALAGAVEGEEAAAGLAEANGGALEFYEERDIGGDQAGTTTVMVRVRVGRASQTARASALVEWVALD